MDAEPNKFGGSRELTGAVDLLSHYKLLPHYEFFCKKPLPLSVSDSYYLHNVVGDRRIRKGEGMQLDQLIQNTTYSKDTSTRIEPFDLDVLSEAFRFKDFSPVDLPSMEKGVLTFPGKTQSDSKDKEKKQKKHKDRDKDNEHKKHKHRHKDRNRDKEKDRERRKDKSGHQNFGSDHSKKHQEKKRKHDADEDLNDVNNHKKSKLKSSKIDELGAIKLAV